MPAQYTLTTRIGEAVLPEKNSSADKAGLDPGAGGKISLWKESDLRGTMNDIVSTALFVTLKARAISHSRAFTAREGKKHMPRCGSDDLYSVRAYSSSAVDSKYRTLPSPLPAKNRMFWPAEKKGINVPADVSIVTCLIGLASWRLSQTKI